MMAEKHELAELLKKSINKNLNVDEITNLYQKMFAIPFPIQDFSKKLGLELKENNLTTNQPDVLDNLAYKDSRKRFAIAHKLAHNLLGHTNEYANYINSNLEIDYNPNELQGEDQAKRLAAAILMPKTEFSTTILNYKTKNSIDKLNATNTEILILELSTKFNVSKQACVLRLKELNYIYKRAWLFL